MASISPIFQEGSEVTPSTQHWAGVTLHSNAGKSAFGSKYYTQFPELAELFVLRSRTETDASKKDSVIFVLISRTNFSSPGFQCSDNAVKSRKRIENKQA
jgi:hypothetical protein